MAIGTGTAGRNRADIICMTYEKDAADGTERAYLEVIRGAETPTGGGKELLRVQVGAYSVASNAKAMADRLKAAGFDAIVVKA